MQVWRTKLDKGVKIYPHGAFVCADGQHLCNACVVEHFDLCRNAPANPCNSEQKQWAIIGCDQPNGQECSNCYKTIGDIPVPRFACNQCEAAMINGVFCHEAGCPNTHERFIEGEWVAVRKCFSCGREVLGAADCCID